MNKITEIEIRENKKGKFNLYINDHHQGTFGHIWTALEKAYYIPDLCLLGKNYIIRVIDKNGLYHGDGDVFYEMLRDKYFNYVIYKDKLKELEFNMENMFKEN